ncbi:GNAT family N-acetyltransferase [Spirosoma validum]|uniref:GNAT family N-acetyltransferase n=1 Tax=Spirosoma validum TaxID=2771355 RepID=A0A927AXL1_9BACT|nr:GNAT family N-acetyltransferase [Spirosoma validum]MBD2751649.1 GNAT family N-acetyltransferase [Spirosoma validum]
MTIRLATVSDAEQLADLAALTMREAFGPPHNPAELVDEYVQSAITVPILEAELADPKSTFFLVSLADGTPIGYAKLRRHTPPRQMPKAYRQFGKAIEIQRIYLSQAHIGQGQGRKLMDYCLDWAQKQGYAAVWLGVWERNERALAFYERMGFERFGYHYFQFGSERQRDFWLQKQLHT